MYQISILKWFAASHRTRTQTEPNRKSVLKGSVSVHPIISIHRLFDDQAARQVLLQVVKQLVRRTRAVGQFQLLQMPQLDQAGQTRRGKQRTAGEGKHLEVPHGAEVLQPEVAHLGAPAQEEGGQR